MGPDLGPGLGPDIGSTGRAARVKDHARMVGFDLVGITGTAVPEAFARYLEALEAGHCADMDYLTENPELRKDVRNVWPEARSVVVCAVSYADTTPSLLDAPLGPDEGYIARYARGRDYHLVVRKMMVQLARRMQHDPHLGGLPSTEQRVFVDTGPVLEKAFAMAAGLGWIGKNTLLIHPGHRPEHRKKGKRPAPRPERGRPLPPGTPLHPDTTTDLDAEGRTLGRGSYYFLAVMLTPLTLAHDTPETDHCGSCRRCLDVCPTGAFPAPYKLDARRCISYWTIESHDPRAVADPATLGPHVFGCDLCQDVCPWNQRTLAAGPPGHFQLAPRPENVRPSLTELGGLDEEAFILRFPKSAVRRVDAAHLREVVGLVKAGQVQTACKKTEPEP